MAVINVGGMVAASDYLIWYISEFDIDFLVVVETKMWCKASALILSKQIGATLRRKVVCCGSPCETLPGSKHFSGHKGPAYGGIWGICLNPRITPVVRGEFCAGVVTISLHVKGMQAVSLVNVYLPPIDSPKEGSLPQRIAVVEAEVASERAHTDQVLIMGDLNTRIGNVPGHRTLDTVKSPCHRRKAVMGMLKRLGMLHLHG